MPPVGRNQKSVASAVQPWGWVDKAVANNSLEITRKRLLTVYRVEGYRECVFKKRPCKCKKNPNCLWGLGDTAWRNGEATKEEPSQIREEGQIAGLLNQGQTCYVNSLLQLWYHNPILRPAILSWNPPYGTNADPYTPECAVGHLQMMFAKMKASKQRSISTASFVTALGLDPGQQQDAEEFSKLLLSCITQLLENSTENHEISEIFKTCFTGESQFETICDRCKTITSGRTEEYNELQLSVMPTLQEAFTHYFKPEKLERDNQYWCNICVEKQDAIRRVKLLKLPEVLNIQLMRFVFDPTTMDKKKVMKYMSFPEVLNMTPHLDPSQRATENGDTSQNTYVLNAVLIHHGNRASSGHYTSHIKDPVSGMWIECNDDKVVEINNKNRSKKLVIKTEGDTENGADSVPDTSLGSKGAYMLVYTRQRYFSEVPPDPELPSCVAERVRVDDADVEKAQLEQKLAQETKALARTNRKMEVDLLYASKYPAESEETPPLPPPTDSSPELEIIGTKEANTKPPPVVEITAMDFISTSWLEIWLSFNPLYGYDRDLPPITNDDILCQHGKLKPPRNLDPATHYKIIPTTVADVLYKNYTGHRLSGLEALCLECVTCHFNFLRDLIKLEADAKRVMDVVKSCDFELLQGGETEHFHSDKFLLGKESLRDWKKYAKKQIEEREKCQGSQDEIEWNLNHELKCPHDALCVNRTIRKRIMLEAFQILVEYFPSAIWYSSGQPECPICLGHEASNALVIDQYKQLAADEKRRLHDLFKGLGRPSSLTPGTFNLVPSSFLESWKEFLRSPVTEPMGIPTVELLCDTQLCSCESPKLMYPFYTLQGELPIDESSLFNKVVMIKPAEMSILLERRTTDVSITVTIDLDTENRTKRKYSHNIGICEESARQWVNSVIERKFTYEADIIVRKIEDEDETRLDLQCNGNGHDHFGEVEEVPSKFARVENESNNGTIRRSGRRRPSRYDHKYKIHSSLIVREFQIHDLVPSFNAGLSDQHLYWNGIEIQENDRNKSFCELRIPAGAVLYLKVDKQVPNGDSKQLEKVRQPAQVERGFTGTALLGSTFATQRVSLGPVSPNTAMELSAASLSPNPVVELPTAPENLMNST